MKSSDCIGNRDQNMLCIPITASRLTFEFGRAEKFCSRLWRVWAALISWLSRLNFLKVCASSSCAESQRQLSRTRQSANETADKKGQTKQERTGEEYISLPKWGATSWRNCRDTSSPLFGSKFSQEPETQTLLRAHCRRFADKPMESRRNNFYRCFAVCQDFVRVFGAWISDEQQADTDDNLHFAG